MSSIRQAVILAGGEGTRLRPLTLTTPKPLTPIHGKPFAEYLVDLLKRNGIEEIIFLTGHLGAQFPAHFGDGSKWGLSIQYSDSPVSDDTGERLRKAKPLLDEEFLLLYGDNYWPLNIEKLLAHHRAMKVPATVTVYVRQESAAKKNNIRVVDGLVRVYDKKREAEGCNGVDIGFFILSKKVLDLVPGGNANFEKTIFPKLIAEGKLAGFLTQHPYWGLTDAARLPSVEKALNPDRKVLFCDRDGVINVKAPKAEYIPSWSQFKFLPGALEALVELSNRGYELFIVSNQSGIARGMVREEDMRDIHNRISALVREHGEMITGVYYCPHGWNDGCECRKPQPGMLYQAAREHDFDLTRAYFVGDDERDKKAGDAVGLQTILVSPDKGLASALDALPR